jgi:hypothetical protein
MSRNLGTPIHCFVQLMRVVLLRSSLITKVESAENSESSPLVLQPDDLWGRPETWGTFRKWSCALVHAHLLNFRNLDFKKK